MLLRTKFLSSFSIFEQKTLWGCRKNVVPFSKLHIKSPGIYFTSDFLMFDDPFCQFPTFSGVFLEGLSERFSLSAEERFEREKSFEQGSVILQNFGVGAKKFRFSAKKSARMPNFCSISPKEHFEENNVVKKKMLLSFSDSDRKTLRSCPRNV